MEVVEVLFQLEGMVLDEPDQIWRVWRVLAKAIGQDSW